MGVVGGSVGNLKTVEQQTHVDPLRAMESLKMPPEEEQAVVRHTFVAALQHKLEL